ncbi:MAG: DEAD/DEAH box helicase family protein [Clostridiales bacterium]|nr:DEAD/DEAH box helicase family protein [Clostridiales bacterium]
MPQEFDIKCVVSEEDVPGGLKVDALPKSYARYKKLFEAAREVRKIDDFRELRIPFYAAFRPFEYQREAVLMMLARFRGKGIFGDQVGLGKTVEVGMTVAEYAARGAVKNVLLLCPRKLDFQWEQEMREKFSEHFSARIVRTFADMRKNDQGGVRVFIMPFDAILHEIRALRETLQADLRAEGAWIEEEGFRARKSSDYAARKKAYEKNNRLYKTLGDEIDKNYLQVFDMYSRDLPEINMLVIDEADALLSADPTRTLQIYTVAEHLGRRSDLPYKILLSATPIRRQLADVYKLMRIVRPEQFRDERDFIRNYCFGKARLNDFYGEEIRQLKGLIDQLFTRNRLTSGTVARSLKPLTIAEALDVNFRNFAATDFEERVRNAVLDGVAFGESDPDRTRSIAEKHMDAYCLETGNHWTDYVRTVLLDPDFAPVRITEQKDRAFAASMRRRMEGEAGAHADALRFACEDYVIPEKRGHHIRYKARRGDSEESNEAYDEAISARYLRKARREYDYAEESEGTLAYYEKPEIECESKFAEFDRLVNEVLQNEKVLVFSGAAQRDTLKRLVDGVQKGRALSGGGDGKGYAAFASDDPRYRNAVYFAVNGEEKGFNMQFCYHLVITDLSHDPNLVEQIVGRISRIGQRNPMHVYVFTPVGSLEHSLYRFYNEVLHLFSDWDGDNTFIIGGAVASYLEENPAARRELLSRLGRSRTADGETVEVGFPQVAEYLWEQYENGFTIGAFEDFAPWKAFVASVRESISSFRDLVREMGEQEMFIGDEEELI